MKVVREQDMLPNYPDTIQNEAEAWYAKALQALKDNQGEWVIVSDETEFHRSKLHTAKFKLLNEGSGHYQTEYRYPELGRCVMYARLPLSTVDRAKRWWNK